MKVCVSTREQGAKLYGLFEYDPGSSANDQQIGTNRKQVAGGCETWDVSGYVDGSNKKAEVYLSTDDSKAHTAKFWD
ncbi:MULTISPECIES: hypothetical protein [unclassified Streptomyces]|uniref:hypothetical protein n=1 Tax=unclassified Streptomyces TaxID=2593676 RepID=UPI00136BE8D6|nr:MULTISPECIES: hypothetical protein [unclassified Streptomyces]NEA03630.1 hypothetical protein [Streptomyces sp. SID10116]MYY84882.1 hypothetical protein [Streptomyces sp. SID335]MYZ14500.1 hypothetical protein [Streptomyces sp. SID337]NDZ92051.1 hypothetical protein [Streptomyces sp. SID10115]NEB50367.1 hypothetical protein [Streptomyces sp. SID339]